MSEQNKAILQRAVEKFNNKENRSGYLELYDANCLMHGVPGVDRGIESIKQFYTAMWTAFPDVTLTLDDIIAEEDKVATRFTVRGTHLGDFMGIPSTGKQINVTGITILRFAAGKCVERWNSADFLGMMQQLGVIPPAGPAR